MEVACQVDISFDLDYIEEVDYKNARDEILALTKMLSKLRNSYIQQ